MMTLFYIICYNELGDHMKIFIDADGCPVVDVTVNIAKEMNIETIIVKNHAHHISSDYATVITVDLSRDSADYYIVNLLSAGDVVITQDYGLSAMVLSKNAHVVNQNGFIIDQYNIDQLLNQRHFSQEMRRKHKIYTHSKKRKPMQNTQYIEILTTLLNKLTSL